MSWNMDPVHSEILFSVRHLMVSKVRGQFDKFEMTIDLSEDNPADSTVEVKIDAASINTSEEERDGHLKSPDFLDVQNHPYLYFKGKRIEVLDDNKAKLIGDLTIRDMTNEVTLDVEYLGQPLNPYGFTIAGFEANTLLERKDWELTWNVHLHTGGVLVGDRIDINIQLEFTKQDQSESEATA